MMRDLFLGVRLPFDTEAKRAVSEKLLLKIMGMVGVLNHGQLLDDPKLPLLYDSNVVYTEPDQLAGPRIRSSRIPDLVRLLRDAGADKETIDIIVRFVRGMEVFLDTKGLYERGRGDCNELAPVRVAELWRMGILASPRMVPFDNDRGGITYHADVVYPDGDVEDPSLILGMGGKARARDRLAEIAKSKARYNRYIAAAHALHQAQGVPLGSLCQQVDMMGFIPRDGVFRIGGEPVRVAPPAPSLIGRRRAMPMVSYRRAA